MTDHHLDITQPNPVRTYITLRRTEPVVWTAGGLTAAGSCFAIAASPVAHPTIAFNAGVGGVILAVFLAAFAFACRISRQIVAQVNRLDESVAQIRETLGLAGDQLTGRRGRNEGGR